MQDDTAPVEQNFHADHPEQPNITSSIGSDPPGTGSQALAFMVAHALANAGFENVRVDSAQNSQAMAEVAKAGFSPGNPHLKTSVIVQHSTLYEGRAKPMQEMVKSHAISAGDPEYIRLLSRHRSQQ